MKLIIYKNYILNKKLDIYFDKKFNIFFIKTFIGFFNFNLPSFYFYKYYKNNISFIFNKKFFYKSFLSHFFYNYNNLINLYIVRLKIKGLGYHIYKITNNIFSFHFQYINFFYILIPYNIIIYWYKKRIILISNNYCLLKIIFKNILILKKLGPYRLLGIRYPRQIILLKKGGKSTLK